MDAVDTSTKTGVMIALLPTSDDWSKIDLPHMTLVYAGTTDELDNSPTALEESEEA